MRSSGRRLASSAADTARAKIVLVGDHRQLGAVGPGGGLEGIADRQVVHVLDENIRQRDPSEVIALANLRVGDVRKAVEWYLAQGAVEIESRRSVALGACAQGWAEDVYAEYDTTMLAWRRRTPSTPSAERTGSALAGSSVPSSTHPAAAAIEAATES